MVCWLLRIDIKGSEAATRVSGIAKQTSRINTLCIRNVMLNCKNSRVDHRVRRQSLPLKNSFPGRGCESMASFFKNLHTTFVLTADGQFNFF